MKRSSSVLAKVIGVTACVILGSGLCFAADQKRVAAVLSGDVDFFKQALSGFKESMGGRGAVAEYNLKDRDAGAIYADIAATKPDLILAIGEEALKGAREKAPDVPVVFCMVYNYKNFSGAKTTGVSLNIPADMKVHNIRKVLPNTRKIGVLYSPDTQSAFAEISDACAKEGIQAHGKRVGSEQEFAGALKEVFGQADCFMMIVDPKIYFSQTLKFLLLESMKGKMPVVGLTSFYTKAGALVSFDCDYRDVGMQAGEMAARIINGERPAGIEVARPRKVRYSLNLMAADKLGVKLSPQAVKEASEVFNN